MKLMFGDLFGEMIQRSQAAGNLVPDAFLAALALEHGLTIISSDSDFARFPGVNGDNPLTLPDG